MGLFDKLLGTREIQLKPKSALALAAMTMISIDGVIEDEELDHLKRILKGDRESFDQAYKVYKDKSVSEIVELVSKQLDQKQKLCVIANLIDIAMADGILAGAEEKLLMSYISSFQLTEDSIRNIVNSAAIKNDLSIFDRVQ